MARYLICDNDSKYGQVFTGVAEATGVAQPRMAYRTPRQNATCERFLGSVRRECLDHLLVLVEGHLRRILVEYVAYFNHAQPHQGLQQHLPAALEEGTVRAGRGSIHAVPVLGGLHYAYERAA